jgi:hypothetical protein
MDDQLIHELKKILSKTLDYKTILQNLSMMLVYPEIQRKLQEFATLEKKESETLNDLISILCADLNLIEHQTVQYPTYWVARPLPVPEDLMSVLNSLIGAERNKETDYHALLINESLGREHKNLLDMHRRQGEARLRYFQSIKISLESKSDPNLIG